MLAGMTADNRFMELALRLARAGLGTCAPNPSVGAVIVRGTDGLAQVVGRGRTQPGGRPHAESQAIARAGDEARGATLYVTLEPCAHHGRTPPCCEAVIAAGIAHVVVAQRDPDDRVAGQGIAAMQDAGIRVDVGIEREAAAWVNAGHVLRVTQSRPFVQLKMAVSADGRIAPGTGKPRWVTGPHARARGHLMRATSDAIVVGRATLLADDPQLTCRLPGLSQHSPLPIVLDSMAATPSSAALLSVAGDRRPLIVCSSSALPAERERLQAAGAEIVSVAAAAGGGVDLPGLLAQLSARGITRLLVEGGPSLWQAFLTAGFVDEVVVFQGPENLGDEGMAALPRSISQQFGEDDGWITVARRHVGRDVMTIYRSSNPAFML